MIEIVRILNLGLVLHLGDGTQSHSLKQSVLVLDRLGVFSLHVGLLLELVVECGSVLLGLLDHLSALEH